MKTVADNKINVTKKLKFVLGRIENIVREGCFLYRVVKSLDCVGKS